MLSAIFIQFSCTNKIGKTVNKVAQVNNSVLIIDSFLFRLNNQFTLIAGYGSMGRPGKTINFIVGISKNSCILYRYETLGDVAVGAGNNNRISTTRLDSASLKSTDGLRLVDFIFQEKFWQLNYNDVDVDDLPCKHLKTIPRCNVSDGSRYLSVISTKNKSVQSKFYAPEFFELECCPGNIERQKFLRFKKIIDSLVPQNLKSIQPNR